MANEIIILGGTAAVIGIIHTISGPDHYLPFIALAKAQRWSSIKTLMVTFACGIGHVMSSVILGFISVLLGIAIFKLETIDSFRGELASWLLIAFGFVYFVWGIHKMTRNKTNKHVHRSKLDVSTPYLLFVIFALGPCEPLIPLIMDPAVKGDIINAMIVAAVFGVATIVTMLCIVLASFYGLSKLSFHRFEKYSHALTGLIILLCGCAIKFLGL